MDVGISPADSVPVVAWYIRQEADPMNEQPPFPLSIPRPPGFGFKEVGKAAALTAIGALAGDLVDRVDIERGHSHSYQRGHHANWDHRWNDWWVLTVAFATPCLDRRPLQARAPKLRQTLETVLVTLGDIIEGRTTDKVRKPKPEGNPKGKYP